VDLYSASLWKHL